VKTQDAYVTWREDPSDDNMATVMKSLNPTISYFVSTLGASDNPQMRHKAKVFAAQAVHSYNPESGAGLSTWTQGQLKRMRRYKRETGGAVRVPDRSQLDAYTIEKARVQYLDDHGSEPDMHQLADAARLPVKRIEAVTAATRPVPSASQLPGAGGALPDYMDEAAEYVYSEADKKDRQILEFSTGYGGVEKLTKANIAKKLGISTAQVTRRTARIGMRLQEMNDDLQSTQE